MYFNHAGMSEIAKQMKCHYFDHYNESGVIVASINKVTGDALSFYQLPDQSWTVAAMVKKQEKHIGSIRLPEQYVARNVAAYFDAVCWALYEDMGDKLTEMITASKLKGYERLAAMSFVDQYTPRVNGDAESDAFGIILEKDSQSRYYNFTPNYPQDGVAQFVVYDRNGNELNFALFDWLYDNDDVVAYMQTAKALITFCEPTMTEDMQFATEVWPDSSVYRIGKE